MATFDGDVIEGGAGGSVPSAGSTHLTATGGNLAAGVGELVPSSGNTHLTVYNGDAKLLGAPIVAPTKYFKMRGKDVDCLPTLTYRTWVVQDTPDPTGASYVGTRCGVTNFADVVIAELWTV